MDLNVGLIIAENITRKSHYHCLLFYCDWNSISSPT